ncbi:MAG: carbon-nitrogen hydrolase family protein [Acidobacteriota bacterium]
MTTVRIALANLRLPTGPEDSVGLAAAGIAEASRLGARVVCFPECYIPGYRWPGTSDPLVDAQFLDGARERVMGAAGQHRITVIMGTERLSDAGRYISAFVVDADGGLAGWQDKVQLDPSEESTYSFPPVERRLFTAGPLTFGVVICHEGWRYPETVRWAARRGAHVVFHPHAHIAEPGSYRPTTFADPANSFHEKAMLCRAAENTCYFASVNGASAGSGTTSAVVRPDGTLESFQPYGVAGLLVADLDLSLATGELAGRRRPVDD